MRRPTHVLLVLCSLALASADLAYHVSVVAGTSHSRCQNTNGYDAVWGADVNGNDYELYHGLDNGCPDLNPTEDGPRTLFTATRSCESQLESVFLCLIVGDDSRKEPYCDSVFQSLNVDELRCVKRDCLTYTMGSCFSIDCNIDEYVAYDINAGHSEVYTQGVQFRVTRSGSCATAAPSKFPTEFPTIAPTAAPSPFPTTLAPTDAPSEPPTFPVPTFSPTTFPTQNPTTPEPTLRPTRSPTLFPTNAPSKSPTHFPTKTIPTSRPTFFGETLSPTLSPISTDSPTSTPTTHPTVPCGKYLDRCNMDGILGANCCLAGLECDEISENLWLCNDRNPSTGSDEDRSSPMGGLDGSTIFLISIVFGLIAAGLVLVAVLKYRHKRAGEVTTRAYKKFDEHKAEDKSVPPDPHADNASTPLRAESLRFSQWEKVSSTHEEAEFDEDDKASV